MERPALYKPFKNTTSSSSKFFVYVKADTKKGYKKIGFGLKGMKDFTQHKDPKRRKSYLARAYFFNFYFFYIIHTIKCLI